MRLLGIAAVALAVGLFLLVAPPEEVPGLASGVEATHATACIAIGDGDEICLPACHGRDCFR